LTTFALAAIDEIRIRGKLVERRLTHGRAEQRGNEIVADDARDETLLRRCTAAMERLRDAMPEADRVHLVARASTEGDEATMTVTIGGVSIVTDGEHAAKDVLRVAQASLPAPLEPQGRRLEARATRRFRWLNGSAAVLLHEAFGHALEHDAPPVDWPHWLHIDAPLKLRRESFRDVPLLRMTNVVVTQQDAPYELRDDSIDIHYVAGGSYDPLTDVVTIDVAIPRFTIRKTRSEIARSIVGARGEPQRYPGVVCSREGQRLVVGSWAPEIITA
jgi:hypothetical protein